MNKSGLVPTRIKNRYLDRWKITLIVALVTLLLLGAILFVFTKSLRLDNYQLQVSDRLENLESRVLLSRIFLDEMLLGGDSLRLNAIAQDLRDCEQLVDSLSLVIEENESRWFVGESGITQQKMDTLRKHLSDLRMGIESLPSGEKERFPKELLNGFHLVKSGLDLLEKDVRDLLFARISKFRKEVFVLMLLTILVLVFFQFVVLRLVGLIVHADKNIIQKTIEVEQKERQRIAMDLHDGLGALLSGMGIHLQLLEQDEAITTATRQKVSELRKMTSSAIQVIEEVTGNLHPGILKRYGLVRALERVCDKLSGLGEIRFEMDARGFNTKLTGATEVIIFRICSELFNNTLKHSRARHARLRLYSQKKQVFIEYYDNGVGFNPSESILDEQKSGIHNLLSRVESLGGTCRIEGNPGLGVAIRIQFLNQ